MDRTKAEEMHATLVDELDAIEEQLALLRANADAVRQLVDGFEKLYPNLSVTPTDEAVDELELPEWEPSNSREAIDAILSDAEDWMTTAAITDAVAQNGWMTDAKDPEAAIRVQLRRMADSGILNRGELDGRTNVYALAWREDIQYAVDDDDDDTDDEGTEQHREVELVQEPPYTEEGQLKAS